MNKLRMIWSLLKTTNYVVITDTINDGYVEPQHAHDFLELIEPLTQHLRVLGREYLLEATKDTTKEKTE